MVRQGTRYVVAGFVGLDLVLGALLLLDSWGRSWLMWSPPDSNVWYLRFNPYPTFYPGLLFIVLGAMSALGLAGDRVRSAADRGAVLRRSAWAHVILGAGLLGATLLLFSSSFVCPDPGVCREVFEPYPPLTIPALLALAAGGCGVVLDRLGARRGSAPPMPRSAGP